jgi:prepilin-type N-terminal cleavage/methylation domain-containing protein
MKNKSPRGFSLVELLIVIAIVAVLLAVVLPSLSKARNIARDTKCLAGARGVHMACTIYSADFKNFYPVSWITNNTFPRSAGSHPGAQWPYHENLVVNGYAERIQFTRRAG